MTLRVLLSSSDCWQASQKTLQPSRRSCGIVICRLSGHFKLLVQFPAICSGGSQGASDS